MEGLGRTPADRRLLAQAVQAADDTLGSALARAKSDGATTPLNGSPSGWPWR